jgi:hypothetical protein
MKYIKKKATKSITMSNKQGNMNKFIYGSSKRKRGK